MKTVLAAGIVLACVAPAGAELTLVARYDWQQGAADVSGSALQHSHRVVVAHDVVTHFDSIEYRYDGAVPSDQRLAIRFNNGSWTTGGWSEPNDFRTFISP